MCPKKRKVELIIGADHGGVALKELLNPYLTTRGITWEDVGTFGTESVDYPDLAEKVALAVSRGKVPRGILICGTGIGMAMTANRFPKVRAAVCNDLFSAKMARAHNDANILALGGRMIGPGLALEIVETFLNTPFERGRHLRRIRKLEVGCSWRK
jgi:ribose 5-phosphate isomerase B